LSAVTRNERCAEGHEITARRAQTRKSCPVSTGCQKSATMGSRRGRISADSLRELIGGCSSPHSPRIPTNPSQRFNPKTTQPPTPDSQIPLVETPCHAPQIENHAMTKHFLRPLDVFGRAGSQALFAIILLSFFPHRRQASLIDVKAGTSSHSEPYNVGAGVPVAIAD